MALRPFDSQSSFSVGSALRRHFRKKTIAAKHWGDCLTKLSCSDLRDCGVWISRPHEFPRGTALKISN